MRGHWLHRRVGSWSDPPPREASRASFAAGLPAVRAGRRAPAGAVA